MPTSDKRLPYRAGEFVVYRATKQSTRPGPRAVNVSPSMHGDHYTYTVDKFWTVADRLRQGRVVARTRRGKTRILNENDPNLRRARWWERWLLKDRFPALTDPDRDRPDG